MDETDHALAASDSEDSDMSDLDISESDLRLIMELETRLETNAHDYDAHVALIDVLRRCYLLERLREARRAMHARFPMTPTLWMDWISDELQAVTQEEDIAKIRQLLEDAHEDYMSVDVWLKHLELVKLFDPELQAGTSHGVENFVQLLERAISVAGLHMIEGGALWDVYIRFECERASSQEMQTAERKQAAYERVREIYRRRLSTPLMDADAAMLAYEAWERDIQAEAAGSGAHQNGTNQVQQDDESEVGTDIVPRQLRRSFELAKRAVELRRPFEESLSAAAAAPSGTHGAADDGGLSTFVSYIQLERSGGSGDPARVRCIYERAIAAFPVMPFLWLQYGRYVEALPDVTWQDIEMVYRRALRNCPWVGELWARLMRATERLSSAQHENQSAGFAVDDDAGARHKKVYSDALGAPLYGPEDLVHVALARADYLRRRADTNKLRDVFSIVQTRLNSQFPDYVDPKLRLTTYWARCECALPSTKDDTRSEGTLKPKTLQQLPEEKSGLEAARRVYEAALATASAKEAGIWLEYARFEIQHGNIDPARGIVGRCLGRRLNENVHAEVCEAWVRFEREYGTEQQHFEALLKAEPILESAAASRAAAYQSQQQYQQQHHQRKPPASDRQQQPRTTQRKSGKGEEQRLPRDQAQRQQQETKGKRRRRDGKEEDEGTVTMRTDRKIEQEEDGGGANSMPPPTKKPKQKPADKTIGRLTEKVSDARAVPGDAAQAQGGREKPSKPPDSKQSSAAAIPRREREVVVRNLPEDSTEASVTSVVASCGEVKRVKLGMDKASGKFRGFAYVAFGALEGAQAALKLNGTELAGQTLTVAPASAPPQGHEAPGQKLQSDFGTRKDRGDDKGGHGSQMPGGSGGGGSMKPRLDFVPRVAIVRKKGPPGGDREAPTGPKTNADFRILLG